MATPVWLYNTNTWLKMDDPFADEQDASFDDKWLESKGYPEVVGFGTGTLKVYENSNPSERYPQYLLKLCFFNLWGPHVFAADDPSLLYVLSLVAPAVHMEFVESRSFDEPARALCFKTFKARLGVEVSKVVCRLVRGHEGLCYTDLHGGLNEVHS